jgi:hypothetical protein
MQTLEILGRSLADEIYLGLAPHDGDKELVPARLYCLKRLRGLPEAYGDVGYSYGGEIERNSRAFSLSLYKRHG